jgi:uncharacterized membrane protein
LIQLRLTARSTDGHVLLISYIWHNIMFSLFWARSSHSSAIDYYTVRFNIVNGNITQQHPIEPENLWFPDIRLLPHIGVNPCCSLVARAVYKSAKVLAFLALLLCIIINLLESCLNHAQLLTSMELMKN